MHMAVGAPPRSSHGAGLRRLFRYARLLGDPRSVRSWRGSANSCRNLFVFCAVLRCVIYGRASMFFRRSLWSLKARHNLASPAHNTTRTTETVRYAVKAQRHHPPGSTVALCHASLWSGSFTPLSVLRLHGLLQISDGGHHRPCGRAQLARDLLKVVSV